MADVGTLYQTSWTPLLVHGSSEPLRPTKLAADWGLNQTLCTRLLQALREHDPVFALRRLPSPGSLRGVLAIARSKSIPPEVIREAEHTVVQFERLIDRVGGAKSSLDTLIARRLDDSREKNEQNAKQMIFRGMTGLLGVEARASVIMCFAFPGTDPDRIDELAVHGYHRLRRLRPELPLMLGTREMLPDCEDQEGALLQTLCDGNVDADGKTTALLDFCTNPFPDIEVRRESGRLLYALPAQPDQVEGELDLFFASLHKNADPRAATDDHPRARYAYIPHNPSRQLVFDVFVHEDLWPGVEPELILARVGNPAAPDLLAHSLDRADFVESVQSLGRSLSAFSTPHYPRYGDLVRSIHTEMGWQADSFRLYRCTVRYPVVGLWYTIQFRLPNKADRHEGNPRDTRH